MRRNLILLIGTLVVVLVPFAALVVTDTHATLGLDLQGGISITLAPVGKATSAQLDTAKEIIEQRVNSLGIAEPQIRRDGSNVVIDLPGVKDADQARALVGQTAQLEFRPVNAVYWDVKSVSGDIPPPKAQLPTAPSEPAPTTVAEAPATTAAEVPATTAAGGGPGKARRAQAGSTAPAPAPAPAPEPAPSTAVPTGTDAPPTTTALPADANLAARLNAADPDLNRCGATSGAPPLTPKNDIKPDQPAVVPGPPGASSKGQPPVDGYVTETKKVRGTTLSITSRCIYEVGPAGVVGGDVGSAKKETTAQGPVVSLTFKGDGPKKWDALAQQQFRKQVAIVLDGVVISSPVIQPDQQAFSSFEGRASISGGNINDQFAGTLSRLIGYGALPVRLQEQSVQDVSPTLGSDQLHAGIIAGVIGLALVMLYMFFFYRILGLVVLGGVTLSFLATYVFIVWQGVVLTLPGVIGLIVSLGVTVDSYVVYFERLKDEVRKGKTVRSSLNESYHRSWRTIWTADVVSLIAAAVLYFMSVGSVRGFAYLLGIATLLDLIVSYTFMYPLVSIMCRRPGLIEARWIGIGSGLESAEAHHGAPKGERREVPA